MARRGARAIANEGARKWTGLGLWLGMGSVSIARRLDVRAAS